MQYTCFVDINPLQDFRYALNALDMCDALDMPAGERDLYHIEFAVRQKYRIAKQYIDKVNI